jgi:hypothetical protein
MVHIDGLAGLLLFLLFIGYHIFVVIMLLRIAADVKEETSETRYLLKNQAEEIEE